MASMPLTLADDLHSCCADGPSLIYSQMELPELLIDFNDVNLWITVCLIIINPLYWISMARWEYRKKSISRLFGTPYRGCVALAASILFLGLIRDYTFKLTVFGQDRWHILHNNLTLWCGYMLVCLGSILVVTSFWALGFRGTFLGDYFGLLLPAKVTKFPFSVLDHPMYCGSSFTFLGYALAQASQVGLVLTALVATMYRVAAHFEGPFTEKIYKEQREKAGKED